MADEHEIELLDCPQHLTVNNLEGGQCLSGHKSKYTPGNSCSYRWQGLEKAKENNHIYDAHRGFYNSPAKGYHIGAYRKVKYAQASYAGETKGEAKPFINNKGKKMATFEALNFTNGKAPYKNDVHHILPNADLKDGLAAKVKDFNTMQHICNSLLFAKYNINHKDNCIILPKKNRHGFEVGLPTHANSHQAGYKDALKKYIKDALQSAIKLISEAEGKSKGHEVIDYVKIKENFELISEEMYEFLANPGEKNRHGIFKSSAGVLSLDELKDFPDIAFS